MKTQSRQHILTSQQWRAALKEGSVGAISRQVPDAVRRDGATVSFVASTAVADRYGDTINQKGWDTSSFEKNPVLLWGHSYSTPPVGRVGKIVKSDTELRAESVEFTPKDIHSFGADVGAMVREGFLNTVSVGFLPKSWEERYAENGVFLGYHFTEMELLEISVVPVPANPQALVAGKSFAQALTRWAAGVSSSPSAAAPVTKAWCEEVLTMVDAAEKLRDMAEKNADADDFGEMLVLLERIATSSELTQRHLSELLIATRSAKGVAPETLNVEADSPLSLAEAIALISKG